MARSRTDCGTHFAGPLWVGEEPGNPLAVVDVRAYGAAGNGTTDDTEAIQAAIDAATAAHHGVVFFPAGEYKVTGELVVHEGIGIMGPGSQGSTKGLGPTITHYSNGHLFVCDGNGAAFAGTGGQFKNLLLLKADSYAGGDAVRIIATDDNHRPGEMVLENILIYGVGAGLWDRGIHIDGTACDTPGARGVRSVLFHKVRVADCRVDYGHIVLNQAVHCFSTYVQVDTGHSTGIVGLVVRGDAENIILNGLNINGTLLYEQAPNVATADVVLSGRANVLDIDHTGLIGAFLGNCPGGLGNASADFRIISTEADAFSARRMTEVANQTGDGTLATVTYDVEDYDRNDSFDPTTGIFTAQCAGVYLFTACVAFGGVTPSSYTRADLNLSTTGSTTLAYNVSTDAESADSSGNLSLSLSKHLKLAEGDTVRVKADVTGGAKTVSIGATSASTVYTWLTCQSV